LAIKTQVGVHHRWLHIWLQKGEGDVMSDFK
jgi:hypothetical protein